MSFLVPPICESLSFCSFCFRSYSLAFSTFMATSLFLCCDRSFWHDVTMPVGKCVMRTAESVTLTCWPPAPLDRKVSIRKSFSGMSISISSSNSGHT